MPLTPRHIVLLARGTLVIGILGVAALILAPLAPFAPLAVFSHLEEADAAVLGAATFYALGAIAFIAHPHRRRRDVAVMLIVVALTLEVTRAILGPQARTFVASSEVVGVLALMAPGWIERLRLAARTYAHVPFGSFTLREERRGRSPAPASTWAPQHSQPTQALSAPGSNQAAGQVRI